LKVAPFPDPKRKEAPVTATSEPRDDQIREVESRSEFMPGGWTPRLVALLILLVFPGELGYLAFVYPLNAVPQIAAEMQTSQVAWVQTMYALVATVTAAMIGNLADRFGQRRILLCVMLSVLLGSVIAMLAPSFGVLLLGRAFQAPALALPFLLPALMRHLFPTKTLPLAVAISVSGAGILSIGAALALGPLITTFGFRSTFAVPAILALILVIVVRLAVPEVPRAELIRRIDVAGALLIGGGVGIILLGVSLGPTWGWGSLLTVGSIALGAVVVVVWVVRSFRVEDPIIDLRELGNLPYAVTLILSGIGLVGVTWFYVLMPTVALAPAGDLGWGLGLDAGGQGLLASAISVGSFTAGFIVGRALSKFLAPTVGVAWMALEVIGYAFVYAGLTDVTLFTIGTLLIGIVGGGCLAICFNMVILIVEKERQASASSIVSLVNNLTSAILPVVIFAVMTSLASGFANGVPIYSRASLTWAIIIPAALAAIAGVFCLILRLGKWGAALQSGTRS
jgi:MFS family permease